MKLIPIQVECYAGTKADETPRRFIREEQSVKVEEVLDRWHQAESKPEWPRADYFKVRGADGQEYLLKHDLEADEWFLGRRWWTRRNQILRFWKPRTLIGKQA